MTTKQFLKLSFLLLALMLPATATAYDFEVDGIYYYYSDDNQVTVTYANDNWDSPGYSGDVIIPETVTYNGTTFSVTSIGVEAFISCSGLTSVNIPNSVTSIGGYAFSGCSGLTGELIIPNSVTSIGDFAFSGCSGLTSVNIPNSVTLICDCAFWGCCGLVSITIPNSVTSIGPATFWGCSGLTSIDIPNSVTSIGPDAFSGCSGLTSVSIPNSVTCIHDNAFRGCDSIAELIWNAKNCTSLGDMPTSSIERLTIGEDVETIGSYMFSGTSGLTGLTWNARNCSSNGNMQTSNIERVTIGENVESLPDNFVKESKITSLFIPKSVTSIGNSAFYHCINLNSIVVESGNNVYDSRDNCNAIIETATNTLIAGSNNAAIPNTVTTIGNGAFYGRGLTSIEIPNSVTVIGESAFSYCSGLASIDIPNSVTIIGESAFSYCSGLASIDIPNSVTFLNNNTFQGCSSLTSVTIPNSVDSIGNYTFSSCSGLTSVTIPNSVKYIGKYAFQGCSGLTSIDISNSITAICEATFRGCTSLTDITIPDNVTTIYKYAFYDCTSLTRVTIGLSVRKFDFGTPSYLVATSFGNCNNIKTLVWNAINCPDNNRIPKTNIEQVIIGNEVEVLPESFVSGSSITSVSIPNSVITIGGNAFSGCTRLDSIDLGDSVISIGNSAFYGCSGLSDKLTIPNSVTTISDYAFYGCSGLTGALTIPNSVTSIGSSAFYGCIGLTSISIPESVTYIGKDAFYNDPMIESVTCAAITPPAWNNISLFSPNVYYHTPLYVPSGKERAYMTDQSWGQFLHIIGVGTQDEVFATSISLNQPQVSLIVGTNSLLIATVLPDSTTNKAVIWASSNPTVASVDATGMVTAVAPGSATITATTTDGSNLSALCTITVNEDMTDFDNYLSIPDTTAFHNETFVIPVRMTNAQEIFAFQTDIYLPEGFTIVTDEDDEYVVMPSNRLTDDHVLMSNDYTDGSIRVICYTPNFLPISGNDGDLFYITVMVPDDAEGDYTIRLQNALLTTGNFNEVAAPNVESVVHVNTYMPGDANNSHTVNVTDIVVAAQYVLGLNPDPFIFEAADMNGDGNVTVTDIMLIAYLINHPTMNAPRRTPALDGGTECMSGEGITLMTGETRTVSILLDNDMDYTAFQMDLTLPEGLTASNFALTDRAGSHAFDVSAISGSKTRALCYSPAIEAIHGHEGALLTFDVTAAGAITGEILVDGLELVTTDCQTVHLDSFAIGVNATTSVNEVASGKVIDHIKYYNLAGQRIDRPESGMTLIVTIYTDGTRTTTKVIK